MQRGRCGKNLTWKLDNNTLTISGRGKIERYSLYNDDRPAPWKNYREFIERIIIEYGVTTIGKSAFKNCKNLTKITIPNSVTSIGRYAFYNCDSLISITIPNSVTSIGRYAFCNCDSLISITIPNSVTEIGDCAFEGCESLKEITIPDSVTEIGESTFESCKRLTKMKIPDGVTKIGESAFLSCESLQEITIPNTVLKINYAVFCGCNSLKAITIPGDVIEIADFAFTDCASLQEIKIPYGLKKLGDEIFVGCNNLKKIYYPAGSGFEEILSEGNNAQLIPYKIDIPSNLELHWNFWGKTLTVGRVRDIKKHSAEELPWLDELHDILKIVIEEGVEKIAAHAFDDCTRLEQLTIPASVKTIGDFAFTFCYCGDRKINGGKNVIWSLTDGKLIIKKNPAARSDADFSTGYETWNVIEKNIESVEIERGVIPSKNFFDWLARMGSNIKVSF